jgi:dTMP kinase
MKNLFITFEGPEGAGKTSVIQAMKEKLANHPDVLFTREPGGIKIAEKIREVILNPTHTEMHERTEALLYAAARAQHFFEKVEPALKVGKSVLCDRFIDSSLAYQGHAREIGIEDVLSINEFAIGTRMPDMTIFFDVTPEVGLARINSNRQDEINRLDQENLSFHQRVYEGYEIVRAQYPARFKVVDASKPLEEVIEDVWTILRSVLL